MSKLPGQQHPINSKNEEKSVISNNDVDITQQNKNKLLLNNNNKNKKKSPSHHHSHTNMNRNNNNNKHQHHQHHHSHNNMNRNNNNNQYQQHHHSHNNRNRNNNNNTYKDKLMNKNNKNNYRNRNNNNQYMEKGFINPELRSSKRRKTTNRTKTNGKRGRNEFNAGNNNDEFSSGSSDNTLNVGNNNKVWRNSDYPSSVATPQVMDEYGNPTTVPRMQSQGHGYHKKDTEDEQKRKIARAVDRFPLNKFIDEKHDKKDEKDDEKFESDEHGNKIIIQNGYIKFTNYLPQYRSVPYHEVYLVWQQMRKMDFFTSPFVAVEPSDIQMKINKHDMIIYIKNKELHDFMSSNDKYKSGEYYDEISKSNITWQYYPPKRKYPNVDIIISGVDKNYMDFNDIKNQVVHQLTMHIKKYFIYRGMKNWKVDDKTQKCLNDLKDIIKKYPSIDIDVDDAFKHYGNDEFSQTAQKIFNNAIKDMNIGGKVKSIRRILDSSSENKMKKTDKISVTLVDINPELLSSLTFYIGLNKTGFGYKDKMKNKMDNFFGKLKQCKYCFALGHTQATCFTKRKEYNDFMKEIRQQLQSGAMSNKEFNDARRQFCPMIICQKCGGTHATNNCMENYEYCKLCGGAHASRINLKCPLIRTLYTLYCNALDLKEKGIDLKRWTNKNILNYKEVLKKQKQQQQQLNKQLNDDNNLNMDENKQNDDNDLNMNDDDNSIVNADTINIDITENDDDQQMQDRERKIANDSANLANKMAGIHELIDNNNNNDNNNDKNDENNNDKNEENSDDRSSSSRSNLISDEDEDEHH